MDEDDFYRRHAGGPVGMTSLTRGRGFSGMLGDNDAHVGLFHHQIFEWSMSLWWPKEHRDRAQAAWLSKQAAPPPGRS
jgi:hypothetical protein